MKTKEMKQQRLQVLGVNYELHLQDLVAEMQLLSHPSVVQDARGTVVRAIVSGVIIREE